MTRACVTIIIINTNINISVKIVINITTCLYHDKKLSLLGRIQKPACAGVVLFQALQYFGRTIEYLGIIFQLMLEINVFSFSNLP